MEIGKGKGKGIKKYLCFFFYVNIMYFNMEGIKILFGYVVC